MQALLAGLLWRPFTPQLGRGPGPTAGSTWSSTRDPPSPVRFGRRAAISAPLSLVAVSARRSSPSFSSLAPGSPPSSPHAPPPSSSSSLHHEQPRRRSPAFARRPGHPWPGRHPVEAADRRHAQEPPVLDRKLRESSSPSPSSQGTAYRLFTFPGSHRLEDYAALLSVKNKHIPFFAPNQPVPVLLALILGLQHALAMARPPLSLHPR